MNVTPKLLSVLCAAALLAACSQENHQAPAASATTTASAPAASDAANATATPPKEGEITVDTVRGPANVPLHPERVAVFDFGMLDDLNALGVKVGATVDNVRLDYVKPAIEGAKGVGTLFEPNFEALHAYNPQLIITGSRTAKAYDELSKVAPTIEMTADTTNMVSSSKARLHDLAAIFGKEARADEVEKELDAAIAEAKVAAQGKGNGLIILVNAGKIAAFSPDSRFGWIHKDIGVPTADGNIHEGSHGQPASFEYIKQTNPDWLFVLDRSAAIGQEGESAQKVLDNPLVHDTNAWKNHHIVYLQPSTYLAAGGVQQLIQQANLLRDAFNQK